MRNQVKPIRRLADAAESFGKGRDVPRFKPEGAREVRQAATAFLRMRERIQRNIAQRTEMLAGVSHDLRTPLTRMKLQLAMMGEWPEAQSLTSDVDDMQRMVEGYLAFARGEGTEQPTRTDLAALLREVCAQMNRDDRPVDLHVEEALVLDLKTGIDQADPDQPDRQRPAARSAGHGLGRAARHRRRGHDRRRRPRYSGRNARGGLQAVLPARPVAQPRRPGAPAWVSRSRATWRAATAAT